MEFDHAILSSGTTVDNPMHAVGCPQGAEVILMVRQIKLPDDNNAIDCHSQPDGLRWLGRGRDCRSRAEEGQFPSPAISRRPRDRVGRTTRNFVRGRYSQNG